MIKHDFSVQNGETFQRTLYFKDAAGSAIELSGRTAQCHIRTTAWTEELTAEISCTIQGDAGIINLFLDAAESAAIPAGRYVYDLRTIDANGAVKYYIGGNFDVFPSVTR